MNYYFILTALLAAIAAAGQPVLAAYPANFHNQTGCLYAYMSNEGQYLVTFPERESQSGKLNKISYSSKTKCTEGNEKGNLVVVFDTNDNNMVSMTLDFDIKPSLSEGYWEVPTVKLTIVPVNKALYPETEMQMRPNDIYAGSSFSYSCNSLVLQNVVTSKETPLLTITLRQFQIQPFAEPPGTVFASSYDCSVWLSLPLIMGTILILFITFTVMIGVYLILEQGNQSSDLRFSKQGGMLMNQAQLEATKG